MAAENKSIGKFSLDGILPSPRGMPQIEVTFDIDANGITNVSAKDKGTGKEQSITITASSGLSEDEINSMVKDAEMHADEDEKRRDDVQKRNEADSMTYTAQKLMDDNEDKIPDDLKTEIADKIAAVRTSLGGEDTELIATASQELQESMQKVGQIVYSQTGGGEGGASSPDGTGDGPGDDSDGPPEGTVEGEFREV